MAPVASNCTVSAGQIFWVVPPLTLGCGFTFTVIVSFAVHELPSVPVTIYVVVVVGDAVGLEQGLQDNPVAGDQVYDVAPVACSPTLKPTHIVLSAPAFTVGNMLTVTVTVAVSLQLAPLMPITVYIVVVVGLAVGLAQLVHDNPVAGDQV